MKRITDVGVRLTAIRRAIRSLSAPQAFVVAAGLFGILRRHRIAVERHDGLLRVAAQQLVRHAVRQFDEWFGDVDSDESPVWFLRVPLQLRSDRAGLIANASGFRSQFGIVHHFLDIAQAVRPVEKIFAADRRELAIRATC